MKLLCFLLLYKVWKKQNKEETKTEKKTLMQTDILK